MGLRFKISDSGNRQDREICWKSTFFIFGNTAMPARLSKMIKMFRILTKFDYFDVFLDFGSSYLPRFRVLQKMKTLYPRLVTVVKSVFFSKKYRKFVHRWSFLKGKSSILQKNIFLKEKHTHTKLRTNPSKSPRNFMKITHILSLFLISA